MIFFHNFEHFSMTTSLILSEIKTIEHGKKCDNLDILLSSNISHFLTCLKTWGKGLKLLKKT